jgi:autotransporter translocation and assembly factor TamB
MQLEIAGEVDVVKEGREPELFGTITVKRGHYDLYGRRFNIKEGKLVFQGGTEYDPLVTLEANYTFRTVEREKKTLTLFVSGKASAPEIKFQLDGRDIPEGDAVAYILFGKSLDQLSSGQKSQVSGGSETDVAKRVAANFVSDRISQTIGKELNLDVIEIKAQNNLSAATFTVGKYLTSDLFVSYQRGIGSFEDQDIAREKVTLEYELTRFIYLQLIEGDSRESGADIIFKYLYK